eukprot:TRINITY_DN8325_c0_g1_i1.p1 TRINITY_DN8325_c0_g1~~TRINITY_DN8325_c0_g1_i1.p1  ORF type:complete len:297 (+),score=51.90 TRINITY_DN8325_c0_g1_i1:45-893(+)
MEGPPSSNNNHYGQMAFTSGPLYPELNPPVFVPSSPYTNMPPSMPQQNQFSTTQNPFLPPVEHLTNPFLGNSPPVMVDQNGQLVYTYSPPVMGGQPMMGGQQMGGQPPMGGSYGFMVPSPQMPPQQPSQPRQTQFTGYPGQFQNVSPQHSGHQSHETQTQPLIQKRVVTPSAPDKLITQTICSALSGSKILNGTANTWNNFFSFVTRANGVSITVKIPISSIAELKKGWGAPSNVKYQGSGHPTIIRIFTNDKKVHTFFNFKGDTLKQCFELLQKLVASYRS